MKNECRDDNYWRDFKTDLRKPISLLDFINQILRRFRFVLYVEMETIFLVFPDETRNRVKFGFQKWSTLCKAAHKQKKCTDFIKR